MILFDAAPLKIKDWVVLHLPKEASEQLPSRGMTMIEGTVNGLPFKAPLEPDGMGSHWFQVDESLQKQTGLSAGKTAHFEVTNLQEWFRPTAPKDVQIALDHDDKAREIWNVITPKAQWEWIRWIQGTNNPETRAKHIVVAMSKMNKGMRRPCCFNARMCSEPYVSKGGVLLV